MIDRLYAGGNRQREVLGEEARLIGGHDLGNGAAEIDRIYKRRAEALHVGERVVADADVFAVGNRRLDHEVAHHAKPLACERPAVRVIRIDDRRPAVCDGRDGVARIIARDHFEQGRRVLDGAAHRAAPVARERQWHDAGAAHQPLRRDHSDQRIERRGKAYRSRGIGAERADREVCGNSRR